MSRAPSDSLDEKSREGDLAKFIFQAISVIPGHPLGEEKEERAEEEEEEEAQTCSRRKQEKTKGAILAAVDSCFMGNHP